MDTHPTKCNQTHTDLQDHTRVNYYLQDIKRQPWTSVRQAEYDGCHGQGRHRQVEKYVRVRVHKAIRNSAGYFFAS
jgi:hypothetical protein